MLRPEPIHLHVIDVKSNEGGGVALPNVQRLMPHVFVMFSLCVDHGAATITDVEPVRPRGSLYVVDWAVYGAKVAHQYLPIDTVPGTAGHLPGYSHDPVRTRCDRHQTEETAFALSVATAWPEGGAADGFRIHYRAGDHTGVVFQPYAIGLSPTAKYHHRVRVGSRLNPP